MWKYAWNAAGMLAKVTRPDGREVTFAYDALGRRIKKTYRGKATHWVWDGNVPLHEWVEITDPAVARESNETTVDANVIALSLREAQLRAQQPQGPPGALRADQGTLSAPITWLFEPESFSPLGKLVGEQRFAIVPDHLGTPVSMTDARGEQVWAAEIDTYGALRELRGERSACPFRWPGQYEDVETGLHYNRFRYYDADAGQYASQDPIGLQAGLRLQAYVRDPLTWHDPLGLTGCGKTPSQQAASWQGKGDYPGVDKWRDIILKKGTVIVGGVPGQTEFYTTLRGMKRAGSSRAAMGRGLQVKPHDQFGYRPAMATYEVLEDTPAAVARTNANPHLGEGGLTQLYVPDYKDALKQVDTIPLPP